MPKRFPVIKTLSKSVWPLVLVINKLLNRYGVEKSICDEIAPFEQIKGMYEASGYDFKSLPISEAHKHTPQEHKETLGV